MNPWTIELIELLNQINSLSKWTILNPCTNFTLGKSECLNKLNPWSNYKLNPLTKLALQSTELINQLKPWTIWTLEPMKPWDKLNPWTNWINETHELIKPMDLINHWDNWTNWTNLNNTTLEQIESLTRLNP